MALGMGLHMHAPPSISFCPQPPAQDDDVTAAAKEAAKTHAEAEAAGERRSGTASADAMRAMIDAACASRPGSAAGAGQSGAWQEEGEEGDEWGSCQVEPVDTKSLRRLQEDMKRRGWLVMPVRAAGAGCGAGRGAACLPCAACLLGACSSSGGTLT